MRSAVYFVLAAAAAASLVAAAAAWSPGNGVKPHIIFILADDLGYNDVGWAEESGGILTENMTRLAEDGIKFDRLVERERECFSNMFTLMWNSHSSVVVTSH